MAANGQLRTAAVFTGFADWGAGYFAINDAGRVEVRPNGPASSPIDLFEQVDQLRQSGLSLPVCWCVSLTFCKTACVS